MHSVTGFKSTNPLAYLLCMSSDPIYCRIVEQLRMTNLFERKYKEIIIV
jgi:hypothetical protein